MRDRMRIPLMAQMLERYWLKVPDWRFGQLIENIKIFANMDDLFFIEDDDFIQIFLEFFESLEKDGTIQIK